MRFKYSNIFIIFCLFFSSISLAEKLDSDDNITARLKGMSCIVKGDNAQSIAQIRAKVAQKSVAETTLGKSSTYFPLIEKELKAAGLPTDLKYLAVIESGLKLRTFSGKGAGGLWQFMPATAISYGLTINSSLDERSDIIKSTQCAVRYLKKLYEIFGDWDMVLAAYNSGPAKVTQAMKIAKSKDFRIVKRFLALETQNYIPAYIATNYIFEYYKYHELKPRLPELDVQNVVAIKIYNYMSLAKLAEITTVDYDVIKNLNASYIEEYVQPGKDGSYVIVPKRCENAVNEYLANADNEGNRELKFVPILINGDAAGLDKDPNYYLTTTIIGDEKLAKLADIFGCSEHHLKLWNDIMGGYVHKGQEIKIYMPRVPGKKV
jgi:membrane-bound lytic murein transglycosylase D